MVAIVTRESAEELGLRPGDMVSGVVKAASVIIERCAADEPLRR